MKGSFFFVSVHDRRDDLRKGKRNGLRRGNWYEVFF